MKAGLCDILCTLWAKVLVGLILPNFEKEDDQKENPE